MQKFLKRLILTRVRFKHRLPCFNEPSFCRACTVVSCADALQIVDIYVHLFIETGSLQLSYTLYIIAYICEVDTPREM